ncbi:SAGA-associated factor [Lobulomyces angularis]|nr:SAGA-associated factor [Lobulomyces angularis]
MSHQNQNQIDPAMQNQILDSLINDAILELVFEVHRHFKNEKSVCQICKTRCHCFVQKGGVDIFGNNSTQTQGERLECPNCSNLFPSVRYAPHMEKCMGLGRNASRNKRSNNNSSPYSVDSEGDDQSNIKKVKRKVSPLRKTLLKKTEPS